MILCSHKNGSLTALFFIFFIYSNAYAMEKGPSSLGVLIMNLVTTSFKTLQEPAPKSLLEQTFETTKTVSIKVVNSCLSHPKLLLCMTGATIFIVSLKKSSLWPITKYDLKKFKKESQLEADHQFLQFKKNNDDACRESIKGLSTLLDTTQNCLHAVQQNLDDHEQTIITLPHRVTTLLALCESREQKNYDQLFERSTMRRTTQLNNVETLALNLLHEDTLALEDFFEQFNQGAIDTQISLDDTLEEFIQTTIDETNDLNKAVQNHKRQEILQSNHLSDSLAEQQHQLNLRFDSLISVMNALADTNQKSDY